MRRWVSALFFASGAAGLVYEVIWSRLLKELFGVTAHAVAAVLATYLLGLALGSWLLGPKVDRYPHPLRLYGLLEIGVAALAASTSFLLPRLAPVHAFAATRLAPDSPALAVVRLVLAATVIVPPTLLMGATLPAMTRACVSNLRGVGRDLSWLYALNTAGAVAGCAASGFLLIGAIGVHPTLWLAVLVNLAVGIVACALPEQAAEPEPAATVAPARMPWLLVAVALSGIASLALEVIWTRVLILIVGTSTYAFVTMLSAFLAGIALGSGLVRLFDRRIHDARRSFGRVQLAIAATTLLGIPLLSAIVSRGQYWLLGLEQRWFALFAARFGLAFAIVLVPATLFGMTFPIAGRIGIGGLKVLGRDLGRLYGANTFGNIAGAILGGFCLVPAFGLQRSIALVVIFNLAAAAWALWPRSWIRAVPLAAALAGCAAFAVAWKPRPFTSLEESEEDTVLYYREGLENTVKVIQRASDARQRVMLVDAVRIGQSSAGIDHKQQVLAHLPFLLRPDNPPRTVLSIGLGTGILMGEVARHGIDSGVCVELSPEVVEGARQFDAFNGGVLDDARVRIVVDDGINFLARSPQRWDAIISDGKSRHGHVGNARFYSEEFFRSGKEHLAPGGVMVQWIPLDEAPDELRTIIRSFSRAFPRFYLWMAHNSLFIAGQSERLSLDLAGAQRVLDAPETAGLRRHGWRSAAELASLLILDADAARPWLGQEDAINSIERPVLEFYSPGVQATPVGTRIAQNVEALLAAGREPPRDLRVAGMAFDVAARNDLLSGIARRDATLLRKAAVESPPGVVRSWSSALLTEMALAAEAEDADHALQLYRAAVEAWPQSVSAQVNLASVLEQKGATLEAIQHAFQAVRLNPDSGVARHLYGTLLIGVGNRDEAIRQLRDAVRIAPNSATAQIDLAQQLALAGRHDEALAHFRDAMRLRKDWAPPMTGAALLLATHPDPELRDPAAAVRLARRAADLTLRKDAATLGILATCYTAADQHEEAAAAEKEAAELVAASTTAANAHATGLARQYRETRALDP